MAVATITTAISAILATYHFVAQTARPKSLIRYTFMHTYIHLVCAYTFLATSYMCGARVFVATLCAHLSYWNCLPLALRCVGKQHLRYRQFNSCKGMQRLN